ncbi:MAG: serine hydrolase [Phycisphaerales bacterium]
MKTMHLLGSIACCSLAAATPLVGCSHATGGARQAQHNSGADAAAPTAPAATSAAPPAKPPATASAAGAPFLHPDAPRAAALDPAAMAAAARYSESVSGRAVLVMQRGEIVFEQYGNGWSASRPHPLASGTKSFTGVLAMAALADGVIPSLDAPVSDLLVEWKDDPRRSKITVRELLTLSSGLDPNSPLLGAQGAGIRNLGSDGLVKEAIRQRLPAQTAPDRFAAALQIPAKTEPGTVFRYGGSHYYVFGAYLERALAKSTRPEKSYWEYLTTRVLVPSGIGVGVDRFAPDVAGRPNLPGGGHLTAREWAKFGEFVRRGGVATVKDADGKTHDEQVIPLALLQQCFEPSRCNEHYGLTWWLLNGKEGEGALVADNPIARKRAFFAPQSPREVQAQQQRQAAQVEAVRDAQGNEIRVAMAAGAGKQRLYILPEQELVVVRFAQMDRDGEKYDDTVFLRTLLGLEKEAPAPAKAAATSSPPPSPPRP